MRSNEIRPKQALADKERDAIIAALEAKLADVTRETEALDDGFADQQARDHEEVKALSFELKAAEARIKRLEEALKRIASCESRHPEDVVAVARAALAGGSDD